jgi:hypothetical protein
MPNDIDTADKDYRTSEEYLTWLASRAPATTPEERTDPEFLRGLFEGYEPPKSEPK